MGIEKEIRLNALDTVCTGFISYGLWAHPRDVSLRYTDIDYWVEYAQLLERGLFDGLFLADRLGVSDVYQGSRDAAVRTSTLVPVNEPTLIVPAMAYATRHLSFVITSNTSYEPPFLFARRMSTLDHLTKGRIGWNIVTGALDSSARAMGFDRLPEHDARYDAAEEYMALMYKLWEGSWGEGSVLRDRESRVFADPSKVHEVRHEGEHYRLNSIHMCEPSPQRTPMLYQAGGSPRGREFAATHAEGIFVNGQSKTSIAASVADIRGRAARLGRDPSKILFFAGLTVIVAPTEAQARAKHDDYMKYFSLDALLAHTSGNINIDLSTVPLDVPLADQTTQGMNHVLSQIAQMGTLRQAMEAMALGGRNILLVGTPEQVVDEMERWIEATDIDGFNVARVIAHESLSDFVDLVVPELQRRGVYKTEYRPGAMRQKLLGQSTPDAPPAHPAHAYKR